MTRRTRRYIFYSLILIFLALGTGATLYAQGWRLDIPSFTIQKVGAIYVRPAPTDAMIFLNGKRVSSGGGIFQKGTLINSLFPKNYNLTLTAPGYFDFKTTIPVTKALVSQLSYAVLVPGEDTVVTTSTRDFFINNEGDMVVTSATGTLVYNAAVLPGNALLGMTNDGQNLLTKNDRSYYWITEAGTLSKNITTLLNGKMTDLAHTDVLVNGDVSSELVLCAPSFLATMDPTTGETTVVAKTKSGRLSKSVALSDSFIVWSEYNSLNNTSRLTLYDRSLKSSRLGEDLLPGKTTALTLVGNDTLGVLEDEGSFYTATIPTFTFKKIASDVRSFEFSPDLSSVALLEHKSIELIPLRNTPDYWRINPPDVETIESVEWYRDGHHLFLHYPDRVVFAEIEQRLPPLLLPVRETKKALYDLARNTLYFIQESSTLASITFPSP